MTTPTPQSHPLAPGSRVARDLGCRCPVLANANGAGRPDGAGGTNYVMSELCPIHGRDYDMIAREHGEDRHLPYHHQRA